MRLYKWLGLIVAVVLVGVLVDVFVINYATYESTTQETTRADLGESATITVEWDDLVMPVPKSSPFYQQFIEATEETLDATTDLCKCEFTAERVSDYKSIVIELPKPRTVKIAASTDGDRPITKVIVPLHGDLYEQSHVIAAGDSKSLSGFTTASYKLQNIQSIAELYYEHVRHTIDQKPFP